MDEPVKITRPLDVFGQTAIYWQNEAKALRAEVESLRTQLAAARAEVEEFRGPALTLVVENGVLNDDLHRTRSDLASVRTDLSVARRQIADCPTCTLQPCPLVNPLCPDDLCVLAAGHEGLHQLGTMSTQVEDRYELSDLMFMVPVGTSRVELVRLGRKRANELRPEG